MVWGALIGAAASALGQRSANRTNIRLARENREFQRFMSNTAVRRRMHDMELAGINPLLAGRYDATTPAGNIATVGNVGLAGAQGAMAGADVMSKRDQRKVFRAQVDNLWHDTAKKRAEANYVQSQDAYAQAQTNTEILRAIGVNTANDIAVLDKQIKQLQIPGVKAESDLWTWLASAELDEMAKVLGKAGPLVAQMIRIFMIRGRIRRR